jgi:hypothetical protein
MKSAGQYAISTTTSSRASISRRVLKNQQSSPMRSSGLVLVGPIGESGLSIKQPMIVTLESDDDGGFLVSDPVFAVYGEGRSAAAAHWDFRSSLQDYFLLLKAHSSRGVEDAQQFQKLKQYVDYDLPRLEYGGNSSR